MEAAEQVQETTAEQVVEELAAAATELTGQCVDCAALRRQLVLVGEDLRQAEERVRVSAQGQNEALAAMQQAVLERDAAIAERDARVADEALRAQRVDVEALRFKVAEMKKMMAAVDARADERFAAQIAAKDRECAARLEQGLAEATARVAAVTENEATASAQIAAVRAGEAERVIAIRAALDLLWAWDRRDRAAPRSAAALVAQLRQVLSAAFVQQQ